MLPFILEFIEHDNAQFAFTSNNKVFTGFEVSISDLETIDTDLTEIAIAEFFKSLDPNVTSRIVMKSDLGTTNIIYNSSRASALTRLGFVSNQLFIFVEMNACSLAELTKAALKLERPGKRGFEVLARKAQELARRFSLASLQNAGLRIRPLLEDELKQSMIQSATPDPARTVSGVDLGHSVVGVIRLNKQPAQSIDIGLLSALKDAFPLPYEIRISVRKISSNKSEVFLRKRTAQTVSTQDRIGAQKYHDSQEQLEEVALNGGSLFSFEFVILVPRLSEDAIRKDANEILQKLKPFGDFVIETFGAGSNFLASQIGFDQHVPLLETDRALPCFLPMFSSGTSEPRSKRKFQRALVVHRKDQSLFDFDLFNPSYDNFSVNVIGRSGRGKSVFTNLLTRALHNDPEISIIKIDVGGSHTKETQLLGGLERKLLLSEPSGINPFRNLGKDYAHSEDVCNVVGNFLNVLLLEEGETSLSKSMRGEIEKAVYSYSQSRPEHGSISDFHAFAKDLPRRDLLSRWTGSGIYKNAFADLNTFETIESRLKYYNFSQIFQANDPDFGQGGLAAVMAQFNLDLMHSQRKLVFIADETPFFIERCFSFFKFSTANVRKFGGSFITIAQKSSDLVVGGDTGIIENSAQKFIFSIDGDPEAFQKRMKLENSDIEKIMALQTVKGKFSEVLFQDCFGSRTLRLQLSPEEYWAFTSSQDDNARINLLLENVKGLKLDQAIRALASVTV